MAQYTTLLQPTQGEYDVNGSERIADDRAAYDMQAQKPFEADTLNTEIMTNRPFTSNWQDSNEIQVRIGCTDEHWLDLQSLRLHVDFIEYSSDEEVVKKPVRKRKCTCEEEGPERAAKTGKRDKKRKPTYESEDETHVTPVKKSRPGLHNYDGTCLCRAGKC